MVVRYSSDSSGSQFDLWRRLLGLRAGRQLGHTTLGAADLHVTSHRLAVDLLGRLSVCYLLDCQPDSIMRGLNEPDPAQTAIDSIGS
jgi:hypothetical protein